MKAEVVVAVAGVVAALAFAGMLFHRINEEDRRAKAALAAIPAPTPEHVNDRPIYAPNSFEVWAWTSSKDGNRVLYITKAGQAQGIRVVYE